MNFVAQKEGKIVRVLQQKGFGFVRHEDMDYFFHRDDFIGHWEDLMEDFLKLGYIDVTFQIATSPRGPRASNVRRNDFPNQAV